MDSLWCMVCGRGIKGGMHGGPCPQCQERSESEPGILMTPKETEEFTINRGKARKMARARATVRGQKTLDEMKAEMKSEVRTEVMAELRAQGIIPTKQKPGVTMHVPGEKKEPKDTVSGPPSKS